MAKYIVTLSKEEHEALGTLASKGKHKSQKILNALILLGCDEGDYQTKRLTNTDFRQPFMFHQKIHHFHTKIYGPITFFQRM